MAYSDRNAVPWGGTRGGARDNAADVGLRRGCWSITCLDAVVASSRSIHERGEEEGIVLLVLSYRTCLSSSCTNVDSCTLLRDGNTNNNVVIFFLESKVRAESLIDGTAQTYCSFIHHSHHPLLGVMM